MQQNKVALITGATSGIGKAFAEKFASMGHDIIITGRRESILSSVANEIAEKYHVNVEKLNIELSDINQLDYIVVKIRELENLDVLVNNAGFATFGLFHQINYSEWDDMVKVHNLATMKLTHTALPKMIKRNSGTIINVSSLSAFNPFPKNAIYAATKAFLNYFTESLHVELMRTKIRVQALCPGMTRTDFHTKMGYKESDVYKDKGMMKAMTPHDVVEESLKYLARNKPICVPGRHNRFMVWMIKWLPRKMLYKSMMDFLEK